MTISNDLLGFTARWTASVRALESQREGCLFNDPWAAALAGQEGEAWMEHRPPDSVIPIIIRTRYFDDFLQRITSQEKVRQVVLMAAGLDTRAFRLSWPEQTRLFELDQASMLAYKDQLLRPGDHPNCERQAIGVDLTASWKEALLKCGFDPHCSSVWLLEGFLFYLSNENLTRILDEVTSLTARGSWLGFDIMNSAMLTSPLTQKWIEMQADAGAPWIGTMDDPVEFLDIRGWQATLTQAGADDANYGRWPFPVIPVNMPDMPHNWYVTAQKVKGKG
ncbi:MAG: SAM-dependent methyltransferase [Anaerolineae bacterium]|nr:SAM-dependent methyltransferase [Anaerolineae bacterium]